MTYYINDEYFGSESYVGTREEFKAGLEKAGTFQEWYRNAYAKREDGEDILDYEEWVENELDEHLSKASPEDIARFPRA
jgi:hypothetical protein